MDNIDRAVGLSFSVKMSKLPKLETLIKESDKNNRSELLDQWIDEKYAAAHPEPVTAEEELEHIR